MIIHVIPSLTYGGAEKILLSIIKKSENKKQHLVITLSKNNPMHQDFINADIHVQIFDLSSFIYLIINLFKLFYTLSKISNTYKKKLIMMCWLYHGCAIGSIFYFINNEINQIWCIHNANLHYKYIGIKVFLASKISSYFSKTVPRKIVYCSSSASVYHNKLGFNSDIGIIIYNGIDALKYDINDAKRNEFRNQEGIINNELVLACIARFDPQKDHFNLFASLELFKRLYCANFKVVLCGVGINTNNKALMSLIYKFNLEDNVIIKGVVNDLSYVYSGIDLLILSSLSEALPNVLIEAMLSGVLCVSTNVGDTANIIANDGWLVEAKNPYELSNAILDANNTRLRIKDAKLMINKGRLRLINQYSLDAMYNNYKKLWAETLSE
jgi:glycosyltransferase involved in cell wall biosynthesis